MIYLKIILKKTKIITPHPKKTLASPVLSLLCGVYK